MAENESKDQESGGGAVAGILKWLAIGVAFFAIATLSPLVTYKVFGIPGGAGGSSDGKAEEAEEHKGPPQYHALDPSLIVSLADGHVMRFLQVDVQIMTRDPEAIAAIETHDPLIRNNLLMLMGAEELATLKTQEGKEQLRQNALNEVREILAAQEGSPGIDDLYFTGFVIQ